MEPDELQYLNQQSDPPGVVKKRIALVVGFLAVLILVWVGISAYRAYSAVSSLRSRQVQFEQIIETGLLNVNPAEIETQITGVRADVLVLETTAGLFRGLMPLLGWVPKYGPLIADAPELLDIADYGSEMAVNAWYALSPGFFELIKADPDGNSVLPIVVKTLESSSYDLEAASASLEKLVAARQGIGKTDAWPFEAQSALARFDKYLPVLQDALYIGKVLPQLLGADESRRYLILAQNEDELRPTGGFISGVGVLVVQDGEIISIDFENANLIDDWQNKPYGYPPQPFNDFMGMDIFLFRDSNFWPDFPTSAEAAMQLFSYSRLTDLDGAIAFDQHFVQSLLQVTGPLQVSALDLIVNSTNVISAMREEWGPGTDQSDWINQRKAFMSPFANAFLDQINNNFDALELKALITMILAAIEQRDLQFYMRDPEVEDALVSAGWAGDLSIQEGQDYLMLVESNLGFNKANAVVDREISYEVQLDEQGQARARLTVNFSHTGQVKEPTCSHRTIYSLNTRYEDLISDCYWNYLRLFVPASSQLVSASEHPLSSDYLLAGNSWPGIARSVDDPAGRYTVFDNFLLLPPGRTDSMTFEYILPSVLGPGTNGQANYSLAIDKQAGINAYPMRISITVPPGKQIESISPEPISSTDRTLVFELIVDADMKIDVQLR